MTNILSDISVDAPSGKDLKYDDSFLLIEQEIDKVYSVSTEESTEWENVKNNSYNFLSSNSKDLKIAVWWVFSNWHLENWIGLNDSLNIFNELLKKYNQNMFPTSMKAKKNTMLWLEEILTREIVEQKLFLDKLSDEQEIIELFQITQNVLLEFLESEDKYFTKIIRYLKTISDQNIQTSKVKEVPKIVKSNIKKKTPTHTSLGVQEKITSISNKDDAIKALSDFKKMGMMLSEYYRDENPFDLKAIKIVRFLSWINIEGLPINKNGLTQINPPSEMTLNKIEETIENQENEDALKLIEKTLERSPYWIDGHYMSYKILEKLHKTQEAKELKYALIAFIQSNEGIEDLQFKNGNLFISIETKVFLESITDKQEIVNTSTNNVDTQDENLFMKMKEMIQNNQTKEAIELLQHKYGTALNYEEKFKLRLRLVKLNILNKDFKTRSVIISGLEKDVQKYNLNEWRPDLASEVYTLVIKYFDVKYMNEEKLNNAYEQLCKIDVSQAFNLK